jgi:hypothetical protein
MRKIISWLFARDEHSAKINTRIAGLAALALTAGLAAGCGSAAAAHHHATAATTSAAPAPAAPAAPL